MKLDILFTAEEAKGRIFQDSNIFVIDVLRATSVMITALANGIERIYPFESVEEVWEASEGLRKENCIRCGERKGLKVEGFDFGNSPLEFLEDLRGKEMYMTTSNGTRALKNIQGQENHIFLASFLNLEACIAFLEKEEKDAVLICAGTDNHFSMDDALLAAKIAKALPMYEKTDATKAMENMLLAGENPHEILKGTKHYTYLESIGFQKDLELCFDTNRYPDILAEFEMEEGWILKK